MKNLRKHRLASHLKRAFRYACLSEGCTSGFKELISLERHSEQSHLEKGGFEIIQTAFHKNCVTYARVFEPYEISQIEQLFRAISPSVESILSHSINVKKNFKYAVVIFCRMQKIDAATGEVVKSQSFPRRNKQFAITPITSLTEIREQLEQTYFATVSFIQDFFDGLGSGWTLEYVEQVNLELGRCKPLAGSSCTAVDLSMIHGGEHLKQFVKPSERRCFLYAVASHFATNEEETLKFVRERFNVKGLSFPVTIKNIDAFQKSNPAIRINVLYGDGKNLFALRACPPESNVEVVNLLMYKVSSDDDDDDEEEEEEVKLSEEKEGDHYHYVCIKDINRFVSTYTRSGGGVNSHQCLEVCLNCLNAFRRSRIQKHQSLCFRNKAQNLVMPEPGETLSFSNYASTHFVPIIGAFDFESAMTTTDGPPHATNYSEEIYKHKPVSYSMVFMDFCGKVLFSRTEASEEKCLELFMKALEDASASLSPFLDRIAEMEIDQEEEARFGESNACHICLRSFTMGQEKVRDHCHWTGKYLGPAHIKCNLSARRPKYIPMYAHNFSGYDSHFVMQALVENREKTKRRKKISGLGYNMEKMRTIQFDRFRFLDSMQFMPTSLAKVTEDLRRSNHDFPILKNMGLYTNDEERKLLTRKGVFPYDLLTNLQKFEEMRNFPAREDFFNILTQRGISEEDYEHGLKVFSIFKCSNMKDYMLLYNELDTGLLLETITQFRLSVMSKFGLDMAHYISLPQYAFQCMLRYTRVDIGLVSDVDMFLFLQQGIRGGVSYCSTRLAQSSEEEKLIYVDANNLYGEAQTQPLPYDSFEWVDEDDFSKVVNEVVSSTQKDTPADDETGYILEVDLNYPIDVHDKHSQFPFAPESVRITPSKLSPYSLSKLTVSNYKAQKLIGSFEDKKNYVIHYRALRQCLDNGLELLKVHRIIKFRQFRYLKPYIEYTNFLRASSSDDLSKTSFKLMNNAIYGKTLEDARRRTKLSICTVPRSAMRCISSPHFTAMKILSPNFVLCFQENESVKVKQCHAVGVSILDHSKVHMYDLYYNQIIPLLNLDPVRGDIRVVMSDTDSFLLSIKTTLSLTSLFKRLDPVMDFSNYPSLHPLYNEKRKGKLGLLKDEMKGGEIREACAIRSKCYSFSTSEGEQHPRCKGCPSLTTKSLPLQMYKDTVKDLREGVRVSYFKIKSKNHVITTNKEKKNIFSAFDDKRYYTCSIHSVPYGHYLYKGDNPLRVCIMCLPPL